MKNIETSASAKRPTLRDQQREQTRQHIVTTARNAFTARDVASVPFDQIARAAGISRATLYLHFPNKEAILLELLQRDLHAVRTIFDTLDAAAREGEAAVIRWLEGYVQVLRRHRRQLRVFNIAVAHDPEVARLIRDHRLTLADRLRLGRARQDAEPRAAADLTRLILLIARIDQVASELIEENTDLDREAALDIVASEILATLVWDQAIEG